MDSRPGKPEKEFFYLSSEEIPMFTDHSHGMSTDRSKDLSEENHFVPKVDSKHIEDRQTEKFNGGILEQLFEKNNQHLEEKNEKQKLMEEYLYNEKPITQIEAADEKKLKKLKNHIVVCGIHSSIYHFILPLRAKYLKTYLQDIVIITENKQIPSRIWDSIAHFTNIFLIQGS